MRISALPLIKEESTMNRRSFSLGLSALAASSALISSPLFAEPVPDPAQAEEVSASVLADRVQNFYDKSKTFRAKFKQRYFIANYSKTKDSDGEVIFQKPGKMSWRYANNGNRVVSDGSRIKVYEKENKQMYEQSIDSSQYPAALAFLLGGGILKKEFHLKKLDAKSLRYEGGYVLLAVPKDPTPAYQQLLL
jgi:outer membrane lipoprotein carrier protein